MAAPATLPIPGAGGVLAAPTLLPTHAGGVVLVAMTGFFMPPRIVLAPAGTRLPRGVHAVVAAVPLAAAPGSGCRRGAIRWAVAAAAAPGDDDKPLQDAFYGDLEAYGVESLKMLSCIEPPAHLIGKAHLIKDALETAVEKARSKEDKIECVKALLYGIYGVVDLGRECAPKEAAPAAVLNMHKEWFQVMVLAARVDDTQAVMESVTRALRIARGTLRDCIGHTDAGAKKLLQFEDPEDW